MLEEETRLMQHAVQRYKTELTLMQNMLFSMYSSVQQELLPEERWVTLLCSVENKSITQKA